MANGSKFDIEVRNKSLRTSWLSRGAAAVNSQGRKPLEFPKKSREALDGRNETVPPFQGFRFVDVHTRGLRPWLLTCAPAGA